MRKRSLYRRLLARRDNLLGDNSTNVQQQRNLGQWQHNRGTVRGRLYAECGKDVQQQDRLDLQLGGDVANIRHRVPVHLHQRIM